MSTGNKVHSDVEQEGTGGLPDHILSVVNDRHRLRVIEAVTQSHHLGDPKLDAVARLAADLMECPYAFVSFVDKNSLWYAGRAGVSEREVSIDHAIGAHVIAADDDEVFVIEDARAIPMFASNPQVIGEPFIRYYAALPLVADGQRIGVLSVTAPEPKTVPSPIQRQRLRDLASIASSMLQLKATERAKAKLDVAIQLEAARHAFALRVAGIASWVWHLDTDTVECGSKLRELFGISGLGSITGEQLLETIHLDDRERVKAALQQCLDEDTEFTSEFRAQSNGKWLFGHGQLMEHGKDGRPKTFAGVFIDVTSRKQAERQHEEDRVKQTLLLRELIHRVKNTLAVIQSITRQTLRATPDPATFAQVFQARITSLAASHTLLADHEWSGANLQQIIAAQVGPLIPGDAERVHAEGPDVNLSAETATQIGLVFHELATNAVKHGSLSTDTGTVHIEWKQDGKYVRVTWSEAGGPPLAEPVKSPSGFGSTLIRMSVSEYEARYRPEGILVSFAIDLRQPKQL